MSTSISMFRPHMDNIPEYPLPDGYTMRAYQTGDIQHWLDFHIPLFDEGDITEDLFWREYGRDETLITQRMFYMVHEKNVMGSISSWFGDDDRGQYLGRIHWVVLHEDYQGKGLANPLLAYALNKLKELGHSQAYLTTETDLIPALNLYLKFSFEPEINSEQDQKTWAEVYENLNLKR